VNRRVGLAGLLALVLVAAACDPGDDSGDFGLRERGHSRPTSSDSLVIGFVGTMSGPDAGSGEDAFEGADLAVHVINRRLDAEEHRFELVTLDDEGDPEHATELVERLAGSDRTVGIVYAGPPEGLPPAEDALALAGIPAVLCYGDLYGARLLSAHVFQASPSYVWEARRLARYILQDRGYRTVGALVEDSLEGRTAAAALRAELGRAGGRLKVALTYQRATDDFTATLDRLRRDEVEALALQGPAQAVGRIVEDIGARGAAYRSTRHARRATDPDKGGGNIQWRPQLLGFDGALSPLTDVELPAGMVAAESYARGAHYLPVPSFAGFRAAFVGWWGALPTGWELRGFDATRMIAWTARRAGGDDGARVLEGLKGVRFGGLDVTLGPDDHTAVSATTVGLWVVPGPGSAVSEAARLPEGLPWVPLARGFSIDGDRTDILPRDWKYLFRHPPPPGAPAPELEDMRFGVTTGRSDPLY
jgi:ABC-type branched-subunit amino acid transport system substrate-binding protein